MYAHGWNKPMYRLRNWYRGSVNAFKESGIGNIEKALTLVAERTGAQPEDLRFVYGFDS
jgi:hypothetical protein